MTRHKPKNYEKVASSGPVTSWFFCLKYIALTSASSKNFEFMSLLAVFAGVARKIPSLVTSGLKDCFNRLHRLHPIGYLCKKKQQNCVFYAHIGDHLILLIKTHNAHKQRILPRTIINTFRKCERGGIETL